jgi:membrane fusion protein (multidrug efflux system)
METAKPPPSGPNPSPSPPPSAERREPARTARPRRRRWGRIALIVVPLLILGGFAYYWFFMRPYESTDDAFIDGDVVPIAPQVAGEVVQLLVQDNQFVKTGDLILEIDPRDYQARLAKAQSDLTAAQTRLEQAKAQVASDQAKVEQEQASLAAAETEAQRTEADLKRYQSLPSPAVSQSQLDLAVAQARSNNASVQVARSRTRSAQAQVSLSQAAAQTAAAQVKGSEAAVRQAQLSLSYTKVSAPEAGFVTHRTVASGSYVQVGQQLVALVPAQVWVTANFKETQLKLMRPGQSVQIHVDAYPQHTFRGHIDSIQRGSGARFSLLPPENATGNYVKVVQRVPVKILIDEAPDPNVPLGPGLSVEPVVRVRGANRAESDNSNSEVRNSKAGSLSP